jgi:hypothetical protein
LTDSLKRLSRSKHRGGLNPFRDQAALVSPTGQAAAAAAAQQDSATYAERRQALADAVGDENAWVLKLYQPLGDEDDGSDGAVVRRPASLYRKSGQLKSKVRSAALVGFVL